MFSCLSHFRSLYVPLVISETIEHATPINAGSPVNNKKSSVVNFFKRFLSLNMRGPGENTIWESSGNKNLRVPYSAAPKMFILGLPALVPTIS